MSDKNQVESSKMHLIALNLYEGKSHLTGLKYMPNKKNRKLSLHYAKLLDLEIFNILENYTVLFYYALTNQIKIQDNKDTIINIALALKNFGAYDIEGKIKLERAINLIRKVALVYRNRAIKKAISTIEKIIIRSPNIPECYLELSKLYQMINNSDRSNDLSKQYDEKLNRLKDIDIIYRDLKEEFQLKKTILNDFIKLRKQYKKILDKDAGIFSYLKILTRFLSEIFIEEGKIFSYKNISDIIDDLLECLEWISIISNLTYFKIKLDKGNDSFILELINAITNLLGRKPEVLSEDQERTLFTPNFSVFNEEVIKYLLHDKYTYPYGTEGLKIYSLGNIDNLPAKNVMVFIQDFVENNQIPIEKVRIIEKANEPFIVVEEKEGAWMKSIFKDSPFMSLTKIDNYDT